MFPVHPFHLPPLFIRDNDVRGAISRRGWSGRGRGAALLSHSMTLRTLGTGPHQPASPTAVCEVPATAVHPGGRMSDWPGPLAQRRPLSKSCNDSLPFFIKAPCRHPSLGHNLGFYPNLLDPKEKLMTSRFGFLFLG